MGGDFLGEKTNQQKNQKKTKGAVLERMEGLIGSLNGGSIDFPLPSGNDGFVWDKRLQEWCESVVRYKEVELKDDGGIVGNNKVVILHREYGKPIRAFFWFFFFSPFFLRRVWDL